jgi:hypothetical protein
MAGCFSCALVAIGAIVSKPQKISRKENCIHSPGNSNYGFRHDPEFDKKESSVKKNLPNFETHRNLSTVSNFERRRFDGCQCC